MRPRLRPMVVEVLESRAVRAGGYQIDSAGDLLASGTIIDRNVTAFAVTPSVVVDLHRDLTLAVSPIAGKPSWTTVATGVQQFQVAPDNSVYALNASGRIIRSTTAGATWQLVDVQATSFSFVGGQFAPVDWFTRNLPDPAVQGLARQDLVGHASITRTDLIASGIYAAVEKDGTVSAAEVQSLLALSGAGAPMGMTDPVRVLSLRVAQLESSQAAANRSAQGLATLVNTWFLGAVHPSPSLHYSAVSGNLFGPSGKPLYSDIQQGDLLDGAVLAAFAADAARGNDIANDITANGDGTWTVRFYVNGKPDYLTVDNQLPYGGALYASIHPQTDPAGSPNILWVALLEKAFAQLDGQGPTPRIANSYGSGDFHLVETFQASSILKALSGQSSLGPSTQALPATMVSKTGELPIWQTNIYLVPGQDYAVIGPDPGTGGMILFNPYGLYGRKLGITSYAGLVSLTPIQIIESLRPDS